MADKIVVTYNLKSSHGQVVRMKPIAVEDSAVPVMSLSDYYVARTVMEALGLKDSDPIKITFEKA